MSSKKAPHKGTRENRCRQMEPVRSLQRANASSAIDLPEAAAAAGGAGATSSNATTDARLSLEPGRAGTQ